MFAFIDWVGYCAMSSNPKLNDLAWMQQSYIENDRSASEIADELGVSVNQVKKALILLNLRKTPPSEIETDQLYQSYVVGEKNLKATADEFGVSVWTIMKWLAVPGIPRRGHRDIDKGTWRGRHHAPESREKISQSKDQGRKLESRCEQCRRTFQYYEILSLKYPTVLRYVSHATTRPSIRRRN